MKSVNKYVEAFNALSVKQEGFKGGDIKPWVSVDSSIYCDVDSAIEIARKSIKNAPIKVDPIGNCFLYTQFVSEGLLNAGIKHTVTVGNVFVNGKPHYQTTEESIKEDLTAGYDPTKNANAHTWITLENGIVLDSTILHSIAKRESRKAIKLIKSMYISSMNGRDDIDYYPYHLGTEYMARVVSGQDKMSFRIIASWTAKTCSVLGSSA
ncbi:MAG: hypothetical protein JKX92_05460 [Porticoccaceae bacterium]|nr:hypothetical protein [Porticoccaceae bacterium]